MASSGCRPASTTPVLGERERTCTPFEGAPREQLDGQGHQDLGRPGEGVGLHLVYVECATEPPVDREVSV